MRSRAAPVSLMALLFATLAFAGCFQDEPLPEPELPEPEPPVPPIPVPDRLVHQTGCRQHVQDYPAPMQPLQEYVPEGFTLAGGSRVPGVTSVAVFIVVCQAAQETVKPDNISALTGPTVHVITAAPVVPPAEEQMENVTRNYIPLSITAPSGPLFERFLAWNFTLTEAANVTEAYSNDGSTFTFDVAWSDATGSYAVTVAGQASSVPSPQNAYRLFAVQDGQAVGSVFVENSVGEGLGTGAALFRYEGEGAPPPVATGTSSDRQAVETYFQFVPIGAAHPEPVLPPEAGGRA